MDCNDRKKGDSEADSTYRILMGVFSSVGVEDSVALASPPDWHPLRIGKDAGPVWKLITTLYAYVTIHRGRG